MSAGTLLGAVRGGEMVPYDNDVDIEMSPASAVKLLFLLRDTRGLVDAPLAYRLPLSSGLFFQSRHLDPEWAKANTWNEVPFKLRDANSCYAYGATKLPFANGYQVFCVRALFSEANALHAS